MKKWIILSLCLVLCLAPTVFGGLGVALAWEDTNIVSPFQYVTVGVEYASSYHIVLFDSATGVHYVTSPRDNNDRHYVDLPYSAFYHVINVIVYQNVFQDGVDPNGYNVPYVDEVYSFAPYTDIVNSVGTPIHHSDTSFLLDETFLRDGRWCLVRIADTLRTSAVSQIISENRDLEHELDSVISDRDRLQAILDSHDKPTEMVGFLGTVFSEVGEFFQIEIFPNITIGTLVAIPLIFGAIFLVLHFVRGA